MFAINSGYSSCEYALISPKIKYAILTVNKYTNCYEILLSVQLLMVVWFMCFARRANSSNKLL